MDTSNTGSGRRHGINPFDCLKDLFSRLPTAKITEITQFAPAAWADAKARRKWSHRQLEQANHCSWLLPGYVYLSFGNGFSLVEMNWNKAGRKTSGPMDSAVRIQT
ncbi:MAG: hypothetical protein ACLPYZ_12265 [Limisphaerales bacterium]